MESTNSRPLPIEKYFRKFQPEIVTAATNNTNNLSTSFTQLLHLITRYKSSVVGPASLIWEINTSRYSSFLESINVFQLGQFRYNVIIKNYLLAFRTSTTIIFGRMNLLWFKSKSSMKSSALKRGQRSVLRIAKGMDSIA